MIRNPFPGPLPYRTADRARFFGRDDMSRILAERILAYRCVTIYGPSSSGKSSLMRASVLPWLAEAHDVQYARVDGWPERDDPTRWLAATMYSDLGLGEPPGEVSAAEGIFLAAQRMARRAERLLVIHLDQLEQLFDARRSAEEVEAFFECVNDLVESQLRNLRIAIAIREDTLGRFLNHLRDQRSILEHGFRVGPLTAEALAAAACRAAAAGEPPQTWAREELQRLLLKVRAPGQARTGAAEVSLPQAQIVCRALFAQRAGEIEGPANAEACAALETLIQAPFTMVLGAGYEDRGTLYQKLAKLLRDHGEIPEEGASLYMILQDCLARFGQDTFDAMFHDAFAAPQQAPPPPLGALGRLIPPGVHLTLLWEPHLPRAIAERQPERTVYAIQPSPISLSGTPCVLRREAGTRAWATVPQIPDEFDLERDIVVLRLYPGASAELSPALTHPELISTITLDMNDDAIHLELGGDGQPPPAWMEALLASARRGPALLLGFSALEDRDRALLRWLYDERPPPEGSAVLLSPDAGALEADLWDGGAGLPGERRIAPVAGDPGRLVDWLDQFERKERT